MKHLLFSLIVSALCFGFSQESKAQTCAYAMVDIYTGRSVQVFSEFSFTTGAACQQAWRECEQNRRYRWNANRYRCQRTQAGGGYNPYPGNPGYPNYPGYPNRGVVQYICHVERVINQFGFLRRVEIHEAGRWGYPNNQTLARQVCALAWQRCQSVLGYGQSCRFLRSFTR